MKLRAGPGIRNAGAYFVGAILGMGANRAFAEVEAELGSDPGETLAFINNLGPEPFG